MARDFLEGSVDVDEVSSTTAVLGQATSPPWPLPVATSLEPIRVMSLASSYMLGIFLDVT